MRKKLLFNTPLEQKNYLLYLIFSREKPNHERVGFNIENLLLRGCTIRNTEAAVGIVIYAGKTYFLFRLTETFPVNILKEISIVEYFNII